MPMVTGTPVITTTIDTPTGVIMGGAGTIRTPVAIGTTDIMAATDAIRSSALLPSLGSLNASLGMAPSHESFLKREIKREEEPRDGRQHDQRSALVDRLGNHRMRDEGEHRTARDRLRKDRDL